MILIAVALTVAVILFLVPAQAQSICKPYAGFVKMLKDKYGETSQGKGVAGSTYVIEIFTGPETFTILATRTDGHACIIAAGKGWQAVPPKNEDTDT